MSIATITDGPPTWNSANPSFHDLHNPSFTAAILPSQVIILAFPFGCSPFNHFIERPSRSRYTIADGKGEKHNLRFYNDDRKETDNQDKGHEGLSGKEV